MHAINGSVLLLALLGRIRQGVCSAVFSNGLDLLDFGARSAEDLKVRRGEVSLAAVSSATLPPFAGLTSGVILGENGNEVALAGLELHAIVGLRKEIEQETAEFEFGRIDGLLSIESLLLKASLFFFVRGGEVANHLRHEIGEAERGEEEKDERLAAGASRSGRATVWARAAFESSKGSWRKSRGIGGRRTASELGNERANPSHQCEDTENGPEGVAQISKLLGNRYHGEKARMRRHVRALQHLSKAAKGRYDAFQHLEGSGSAVVESVCQAVGIIAHASHASVHATTIHASHAHAAVTAIPSVHTSHTTHASIASSKS